MVHPLQINNTHNLRHYHQRAVHLVKLDMYKPNAGHERAHHFMKKCDLICSVIYIPQVQIRSRSKFITKRPCPQTLQLAYEKSLRAPSTPYTLKVGAFSNLSMTPLSKFQISGQGLMFMLTFVVTIPGLGPACASPKKYPRSENYNFLVH